MDAAKLGNITYGYVGKSLYPDFILYYGGGFANMKNISIKYIPAIFVLPNYGDAPEDIEAIKKELICGNKNRRRIKTKINKGG